MLSKNVRFPNINYSYWSEKNNYFADIPLIGTIKIGLEHARKGGLVDTALKNANIKTNKNLVDLIESKIKTYPQIEKFEDDELMLIFDLIQAWGGKTGRNIYVKPKGSPTRTSYAKLAATYRNAMSCCTAGDFQSALVKITSIPNIGESFATKHIFFWSEFGPRRKALPIYDTRIKTLLFFKATSASDYNSYVEVLNRKANELSMTSALVERALFAFSQNLVGCRHQPCGTE